MNEIDELVKQLEKAQENYSGYTYLLIQDDIALGKVILQDIADFKERVRYVLDKE